MGAQSDVRLTIRVDRDVKERAGYTPSDITNVFQAAVESEVAENKRNGFPVARYDAATKRAYLEFNDGTRDHVNG